MRRDEIPLENEMWSGAFDVARELGRVCSTLGTTEQLRSRFAREGVLIFESSVEEDRTIEIQLLDDDSISIEFAGFSDGPMGTVGVGGRSNSAGIVLDVPMSYENGVPIQAVNL